MRHRLFAAAFFALASAAFAVSPGSVVFIASAGKGQGSCPGGVCSQWVTSVWIFNPSAQAATVEMAFLERNKDNSSPVTRTVTVPAGETLAFPDVMGSPFGLNGLFGAIRFVASVPVAVTGRIFDSNVTTAKGKGSAGQFFAGVNALDSLGTGESSDVIGLDQDAGGAYRSNAGFVEVTGHAVTVLAERLAADGTALGSKSYSVLPFEARQFNLDELGVAAGTNQRARFTVSGGSGRIIAFGSCIDNVTGDPSTVTMVEPGRDPLYLAGVWTGSWYNTTFGSSGAAKLTLSYTPATETLQATVDLDGNVFGGSNPPPATFTAALGGSGFVFTGSAASYGQVSTTIDTHGIITGTLTAVPTGGISSVDLRGSVVSGVMGVQYTIHFTPSGTAAGFIVLNKT